MVFFFVVFDMKVFVCFAFFFETRSQRSGAFVRWLDHEDKALTEDISAVKKRSLFTPTMCTDKTALIPTTWILCDYTHGGQFKRCSPEYREIISEVEFHLGRVRSLFLRQGRVRSLFLRQGLTVSQICLTLAFLLPQPLECWDTGVHHHTPALKFPFFKKAIIHVL
jgi:hypothetical protein